MRLIDADALKKELYIMTEWNGDVHRVISAIAIDDAPTVEERPTGKWIIDVCEAGKVWDSHCSKCNKDPLRFVAGTEDWWIYKEDLPTYCPHCGAAMEVDE